MRGPIECSNTGVRRPFVQLIESISSGASDTMLSAFVASGGSIETGPTGDSEPRTRQRPAPDREVRQRGVVTDVQS